MTDAKLIYTCCWVPLTPGPGHILMFGTQVETEEKERRKSKPTNDGVKYPWYVATYPLKTTVLRSGRVLSNPDYVTFL